VKKFAVTQVRISRKLRFTHHNYFSDGFRRGAIHIRLLKSEGMEFV